METSLLLKYIFLRSKAPFHYASRYNHTDARDEETLIISNSCSHLSACDMCLLQGRYYGLLLRTLAFMLKPADDEFDRCKLASRTPPSQAHADDAEE